MARFPNHFCQTECGIRFVIASIVPECLDVVSGIRWHFLIVIVINKCKLQIFIMIVNFTSVKIKHSRSLGRLLNGRLSCASSLSHKLNNPKGAFCSHNVAIILCFSIFYNSLMRFPPFLRFENFGSGRPSAGIFRFSRSRVCSLLSQSLRDCFK